MTQFKKAQIRAEVLENCWREISWYVTNADERIKGYIEADSDRPDEEKQYTDDIEMYQYRKDVLKDVERALEKLL